MESQGVRCNVRASDGFERAVDEATGGLAMPYGKHDDDTVKYVVNEAVFDLASNIAAANKAANDSKNENFNSYWSQNKAKW